MSAPVLPQAPAEVLARVPEGYRVRPLGPDDAEEVWALDQDVFGPDAWSLDLVRDELTHPQWRRYWGVAPSGTEDLIAYVGVQYTPAIADIQTIGVRHEHTGRGLARYLLGLGIERAGAWGATDVMLEVRVDNDRAVALYERNGFRTIHVRPRYYPDGTDALIMIKHLTRTPGTGQESKEKP